jgi:hypothetical protein
MQSGSVGGARIVRPVRAMAVTGLFVLGMATVAQAQTAPPGEGASFQSVAGVGFTQVHGETAAAPAAAASQVRVARSTVPEPSSALLVFLGGVAGLWAWRRSRLWRSER